VLLLYGFRRATGQQCPRKTPAELGPRGGHSALSPPMRKPPQTGSLAQRSHARTPEKINASRDPIAALTGGSLQRTIPSSSGLPSSAQPSDIQRQRPASVLGRLFEAVPVPMSSRQLRRVHAVASLILQLKHELHLTRGLDAQKQPRRSAVRLIQAPRFPHPSRRAGCRPDFRTTAESAGGERLMGENRTVPRPRSRPRVDARGSSVRDPACDHHAGLRVSDLATSLVWAWKLTVRLPASGRAANPADWAPLLGQTSCSLWRARARLFRGQSPTGVRRPGGWHFGVGPGPVERGSCRVCRAPFDAPTGGRDLRGVAGATRPHAAADQRVVHRHREWDAAIDVTGNLPGV
jgi:hypothetical protein